MKLALKKFCLHRGCNTLVETGYCEVHAKDKQAARQQYDANRPAWHDMYNNDRWRKARLRHLRHNPLCVECAKLGRVVTARAVDHIKSHKGDYELFWDESNYQSLCLKHHNSKTAKDESKRVGS